VPRLLLVAITFTQPFLIQRAVSFFNEPESIHSRNIGYGLIGATFIIYLTKAGLNTGYRQLFCKAITSFRGAIIALIFEKTLEMQEGTTPAAVALISSDVISCVNTMPMLNEVWASAIEVPTPSQM